VAGSVISSQIVNVARSAETIAAVPLRDNRASVRSQSFVEHQIAAAVGRRDALLLTSHRRDGSFYGMSKEEPVQKQSDVLQGTLDLMVLKTLEAMGAQHGYGIARRIEQLSRDVLRLNEGTVYTSLLRLQQQGWIAST